MSSAAEKPIPKTLGRQVSWTLPANAIYGLCNLMLIVVLNKLGNTAEVGRYGLALAITSPIFLCASLRFSTVLASDMRKHVRLSEYFTLRTVMLAISLAVVFGALLYRGATDIAVLVAIVATTKSIEAITDLCCGVQQRIERMDRIAISLVANGLAMIGVFAATYYLSRSLNLAAAGLLFARTVVMLVYDIPVARLAAKQPVFNATDAGRKVGVAVRDEWPERRRRLWSLLLSAAPLGFTAALLSLTSNIPRLAIPVIFDEETLGLFVSLAVVLQAGNLIFRAVEQPAVPRLAAAVEKRDGQRFWKLMLKLCGGFAAIAVIGSALSLLIGGRVLSLVFTPQYLTLGGVLAMLTVATAVAQVAGMIESSLIAARVIPVQVPMHCITVVMSFALSFLLIPQYKLYGAVLAVTICRIPFIVIGVLLLRQKLNKPPGSPSKDSEPNDVRGDGRRIAA